MKINKELEGAEWLVLALIIFFSFLITLSDYLSVQDIGVSNLFIVPLIFSTFIFKHKKLNIKITILYSILVLAGVFFYDNVDSFFLIRRFLTVIVLIIVCILSFKIIGLLDDSYKNSILLKEAFDITPFGLALLSEDGVIKKCNEALLTITGYQIDELLDHKFRSVLPDKQSDIEIDDFQEMISENDFVFHLTKEGGLTPVSYQVNDFTLGGVKNYVLIVHDLSTQMKNTLISRRLATVAKNSIDALFSVSKKGNILSWNKGAIEIFRLSEDDAIGKSIYTLFDEHQLSDLKESFDKALLGTPVFLLETRTPFEESFIDLQVTLSPIFDVLTKDVNEVICTIRDITDFKVYQRELERSNNELEEFAYIISHDLQAPLRHISSFSQILEASLENMNDQAKRSLEVILGSTQKMSELIFSLLDYSRVGKESDVLNRVSIKEVFDEIISFYELEIEKDNIEIVTDISGDIFIKRVHLHQLIQNFIDNSIKFKKNNTPLKIGVYTSFKKDTLILTFTDNGIGVKQEYQDKIFKVFQRLPDAKDIKGTGIGLALCFKIAAIYGGKIKVESIYGEGTSFKVYLKVKHWKEGDSDGHSKR